MEKVLTNQDVMEMNRIQESFIKYGRFLEKNGIESNNDTYNYENFLNQELLDKQEKDEDVDAYKKYDVSDKDIEYRDFVSFISEQIEWRHDLIIIEGEEYSRFMESNKDDEEMQMNIIDSNKFYDEFRKITGIGRLEFEKCFVSGYIENWGNRANLIVNINEVNHRYIIDVV